MGSSGYYGHYTLHTPAARQKPWEAAATMAITPFIPTPPDKNLGGNGYIAITIPYTHAVNKRPPLVGQWIATRAWEPAKARRPCFWVTRPDTIQA